MSNYTALPEFPGSNQQGAVGWESSTTIRPGFTVEASEWQFQDQQAFQKVGEDKLKLHFKVSGRSSLRFGDDVLFDVKPAMMSYLIHPEGEMKHEFFAGDVPEHSVTLVCDKEFSRRLLDEHLGDLPQCVRAFVSSGSEGMGAGAITAPHATWPIVNALMRPQSGTALQMVMYEARALELLHHAMATMIQNSPIPTFVRAKDRKRVQEACAMMEGSGPPMSISQMSRLLAWNETQMMGCFKQVTGTTISEYRNRVRMINALHELQTTDLSVTEVALNAGYDYPGNFTAAFKRTFGFAPRSAR